MSTTLVKERKVISIKDALRKNSGLYHVCGKLVAQTIIIETSISAIIT